MLISLSHLLKPNDQDMIEEKKLSCKHFYQYRPDKHGAEVATGEQIHKPNKRSCRQKVRRATDWCAAQT